MSRRITPAQLRGIETICWHIDKFGYPPTRAELSAFLGYKSANASQDLLLGLERKGYIELSRGEARGIKLLKRPEHAKRRGAIVSKLNEGIEIRCNGSVMLLDRVQARVTHRKIGRLLGKVVNE